MRICKFSGRLIQNYLLFLFLISLPGGGKCLYAQSARKKVAEGNKLYMEEKYDEASNKYQDALLEDPTSTQIRFNMGNALFKKKKYDKALEAYGNVLNDKDPLFQSKANYNIGNTLYKQGELAKSIEAYEAALRLNPDDIDAKYNLDFVRNQLKQNTRPQDMDQDKEDQQQDQEKEQDKGKEQQEQSEERKEQQGQEQDETGDEKEQQSGEPEQKKEMSEEEARNLLLDKLKEDPKKIMKRQKNDGKRARVVKDW